MRAGHSRIWRKEIEPHRVDGLDLVGEPYGGFRFDKFYVICSAGAGWEHVSISREDRTPSWEEMCRFKELFWEDEEAVIQIHPPKSQYVNNHPHCLHLWRSLEQSQPLPAHGLVGVLKESA